MLRLPHPPTRRGLSHEVTEDNEEEEANKYYSYDAEWLSAAHGRQSPPKGFRKVGDEVVERELDDDGLGLT